MLCGWNRGRRLSVIIDHQCRISHGCGGMARTTPRCFARTALRHRASFSFRRGCGGGRGCTGDDDTPWCVCVVRLRTAGRFSWREDGKGREERGTGTHRGATHLASQLKLDRPSRCERPWPGKAHEGGAALTFSVVVVYFGCCLVAADASLCIHLSSVSVRQLFSGLCTRITSERTH